MTMHDAQRPPLLGRVERACLVAAGACLVAMVLSIGAEVLARSVFHYSFEIVDELGGYLLVAVSFLALAPALASGAFHSVELVHSRLSQRARRWLDRLFAALSLLFAGVMLFTIARYVWQTHTQGDVAPTSLQTPLWIPQLTMPLGMAALLWTLARRLRRPSTDAASHGEQP